jgi:hypothetical protein
VVDQLTVEFDGASRGAERLTCGQRVIWRTIEEYVPGDEPRSLAFAVDIPHGIGRAAVLAAVRELLVRNETLRTTYRRDAAGKPVQVVAGSGRIAIHVDEVADADLPRRRTQVWRRLSRIHFEVDEQQLRASLIESDGRPRVLVVGLSHLAVDMWSVSRLARQLDRLLRGRPAGPMARQPREQARHERSDAGRRATERNLRYWREQVASCPQTLLPRPRRQEGRRPRRRAVLRSVALGGALDRLTRTHRLSPPSVLLAALAFVLAARADDHDRHRFSCLLTVGHRFDPALRDYIGTTVQHALASFEVEPASMVRTARAALPGVLAAARYSQADPTEIARLMERVAADRGIHPEWVVVNVSGRMPGVGDAAEDRGVSSIEHDAPASLVEELPSVEPGLGPCELEVVTAGGVTGLELAVDPAVVPPPDVEPTVRGLERLLLDAARGADPTVADAAALLGSRAGTYPGELVRVDNCRVDLTAVTALLADAAGSPDAAAFLEHDEESGRRIVGYVRPGDPGATPETLHARCLAALSARPTAMAPHVYVLCRSAPAEVGTREGWAMQEVRSRGTGRVPGRAGDEAAASV